MTDVGAQVAMRAVIANIGVSVTLQRVSGYAPNVTTVASATVQAIVRSVTGDTTAEGQAGLGASQPGAVSQDDRTVTLMAADLVAAGFPTPVVKGDLVVLPLSDELLKVSRVDPYRRTFTGAIELTATGIS